MEKHYCDWCGKEIEGRVYHMTISPNDYIYGLIGANMDPWQKEYELCEICAKVIIPKLVENHLCECEEKSRDDACKPSEGHEMLYTYTTEDGRVIKCNDYWSLAKIKALETGKCKIVPMEAE